MSNTKVVSNEQIVAALLSSGTIREAAEDLSISERTIYDRMKDGDFQLLYKSAKADLLRSVVFELQNQMTSAVVAITQIMHDRNVNPAIRLQAANSILNSAAKMSKSLDVIETSAVRQSEDNDFLGVKDDLPWH